jgi:sugar lactone lactonase YvrE
MGFEDARLIPLDGEGPEDVLVDDAGRVLTGLIDGRVVRVDPERRIIETIAEVPGRPLGLEFLGGDELVVCASDGGLLAVSLTGERVRVLVERVDGERLRAVNNAAVAADGTIYFTDSSRRFRIPQWRADLVVRTRSGRLFRRDPDGTVTTLLDGLEFANGVAVAPDGSWVAVAETTTGRLRRVWLTGERAGRSEVFVDDLGGYPDNIALGTDGLVWVALPNPRLAVLEAVHRAPTPVREVVARIPERLQPRPTRTVGVAAVDPSGRVVHRLWGTLDGLPLLTGIREVGGVVWLGSLQGRAIASLPVAAVGQPRP